MLEVGDVAPGFSLLDADMDEFELDRERGQHHVVLFFYPRAKTPGCTLQATELSDQESAFARNACIVVGISPDEVNTNAAIRDGEGLALRLLSDEDGEVCRQYGVYRAPTAKGGRIGVERSTFIIDRDGVIRHILRDVSPRGHAAEVLHLVRQLDT